MNALEALNALNEIGKLCVLWEIDPETLDVYTFTNAQHKTVLRARGVSRGIIVTLDVVRN